MFWEAVAAVRPDLSRAYNPWESLTAPDVVRALLVDAGATGIQVEAVSGIHPLCSGDDFWRIVLGSGYRATYDAMAANEQRSVHTRTLDSLTRSGVTEVETNVVYATATKPRPNQD